MRADIIEMAKEAGLFIGYDSEGHFSGVVDEEIIDLYPAKDKERDRLAREQRFVEILTPFAQRVAKKCAEIADTAEPYQSADLIRKHFGVEK